MAVLQIPEFWQIMVLATVQGVAEFLPISSSGHLVVLQEWMGEHRESADVNIFLHFGTLLAILVYYRRQIISLLNQDRRVVPLIVLGTVPAAGIGLWLKRNHEWILHQPLLAGFMFIITAFMLMLLSRQRTDNRRLSYAQLTVWQVLLIGLAQSFALLPGISRSGATIVAGVLLGLRPKAAATFSFLLAIPAIAGASALTTFDIIQQGAETPIAYLACGALVAFGVGLVALHWLMRSIEKGRIHWYAYWLIPLGFLVIVWQLIEISTRGLAG